MSMRHRAFASFLILTFAITGGCQSKPGADYGKLGLVSVSGRVTLDGRSLVRAVITFEDSQDGTFSFGLTDSGGYYKLRLDSDMMGVKPGRKVVRISTTRKILGLNTTEKGGESSSDDPAVQSEPEKELVPDMYYKKSELTAEVGASTRSFNFELKSSPTSGGGS